MDISKIIEINLKQKIRMVKPVMQMQLLLDSCLQRIEFIAEKEVIPVFMKLGKK